jgi:hydroxymethylglutaryl-CoA reductase (NADPH)
MTQNAGVKMITDEAQADTRPMSEPERVLDSGSHQVGPLPYPPVNYTTGDAASQNMTAKATLAACEWIKAHHPGRAEYELTGAIDTDKKHSHITMLLPNGKRVVAEAEINNNVLKRLMGVDTDTVYDYRQVHMVGETLAGSPSNSAHAANGLTAMVDSHERLSRNR